MGWHPSPSTACASRGPQPSIMNLAFRVAGPFQEVHAMLSYSRRQNSTCFEQTYRARLPRCPMPRLHDVLDAAYLPMSCSPWLLAGCVSCGRGGLGWVSIIGVCESPAVRAGVLDLPKAMEAMEIGKPDLARVTRRLSQETCARHGIRLSCLLGLG